jgi:hypothetical protein
MTTKNVPANRTHPRLIPASTAPPIEIECLVGIEVVAGWLDCSADTIRNRCCREGLPHRRFGRRYKFVPSEVKEWMAKGRVIVRATPPIAALKAEIPTVNTLGKSRFREEVRGTR